MTKASLTSVRRTAAILAALFTALLVLTSCTASGEDTPEPPADEGPRVEIISLDHPPMQPIVAEIDTLLEPYRDRVTVRHYDAEAEDGKQLAESKGLTGHVSLVVLVNGEPEVTLDGRTVRFEGFPQGKAPMKSAEGEWTMEDLRSALDQELTGT
jgi:hypothetical protein